jgi:hypothetical protein
MGRTLVRDVLYLVGASWWASITLSIYIYIDTHTMALKCTHVYFSLRMHRPQDSLSDQST